MPTARGSGVHSARTMFKAAHAHAEALPVKGQAALRGRLHDQAGFSLFEVMVSALVVALVAAATVASIGTSQKISTRTAARGIAVNLAEQDQERMRAMRTRDLVNYSADRSVTQSRADYGIHSETEFVQGPSGGTVSCTSNGEQSRYLRLTTVVTPQASLEEKPVTMRSFQALPINDFSPTSGTLLSQIFAADGTTGQANITVSTSGPESRSASTNSAGCAIFQFLTPGTYSLNVNRAGFVDRSLNQSVTFSAPVTAGLINQATPLLYDRAGSIRATFNGTTTSGNSGGLTISNGGIPSPSTRTFSGRAATGLFPFTAPYLVYAGMCAVNNPSLYPPSPVPTATVGAGVADVPVDLHEPPVTPPQVQVAWRPSSSTVTQAPSFSGNNVRVRYRLNDACQLPTVPTSSLPTSGVPNAASVIRLPYGNYRICAEYTKTVGGSTGRTGAYSQVVTGNAIANTQETGPAATPAPVTIDTQAGSGVTNNVSCASRGY